MGVVLLCSLPTHLFFVFVFFFDYHATGIRRDHSAFEYLHTFRHHGSSCFRYCCSESHLSLQTPEVVKIIRRRVGGHVQRTHTQQRNTSTKEKGKRKPTICKRPTATSSKVLSYLTTSWKTINHSCRYVRLQRERERSTGIVNLSGHHDRNGWSRARRIGPSRERRPLSLFIPPPSSPMAIDIITAVATHTHKLLSSSFRFLDNCRLCFISDIAYRLTFFRALFWVAHPLP